MDRLDGIAVFAHVVDGGSFTAAAARLRISKSAASAAIQRLEERLGITLLTRTTRRVAPTEAGLAYHRHCVRILAEVEAGEQVAAALHREPRGTLRISAPETFAWMHVAPAIPAFRAAFPEVAVDLSVAERHVDLVEERLDLAIRIGARPDLPLVVRRLATSRAVLCASPAYLRRHGPPATPAALSAHPGLCFPPLWRDQRWALTARGRAERVPIAAAMVSNSAEALRIAALGGMGIAMLPTWAIGEDLRAGRLRTVLDGWTPPPSAIHAVYAANRRASAKVRAFVDHLARHIGREPRWERAPPTRSR